MDSVTSLMYWKDRQKIRSKCCQMQNFLMNCDTECMGWVVLRLWGFELIFEELHVFLQT